MHPDLTTRPPEEEGPAEGAPADADAGSLAVARATSPTGPNTDSSAREKPT
jgi:hypothetical protein